MQQQRRLALHVSALGDAEYTLYTASFKDLVDDPEAEARGKGDDEHLERMRVGVREVRGWLRGRYSGVASAVIDSILRLFSPTLAHGDTLSGAEFFAALRLVVHAQSGTINTSTEVDRALAFVQADPSVPLPAIIHTRSPPSSRAQSPAKTPRHHPHTDLPPPPKPFRRQTSVSVPPSASPSSTPASAHNPFAVQQAPPPLHPSQRDGSNPFTSHSSTRHPAPPPSSSTRSDDGGPRPPLPPRKSAAMPPQSTTHIVPVPPVPPPRRTERSVSPNKLVSSFAGATRAAPPLPPPKPPHHLTSALMQQSLAASSAGQSQAKAQAMREKERVMRVLRSSSGITASPPVDDAPPLPQRKPGRAPPPPPAQSSKPSQTRGRAHGDDDAYAYEPRQQPSPPMSTSSLEQVALASVPTFASSEKGKWPERAEEAERPPPMHPDRTRYAGSNSGRDGAGRREANLESFEAVYGASSSSALNAFPSQAQISSPFGPTSPTSPTSPGTGPNTPRVLRSKSMHHPSPPPTFSSPTAAPPPPERRRRPESVQVLPAAGTSGGVYGGYSGLGLARGATLAGASVHRRSSLSVASTPPRGEDPFAPSPASPTASHASFHSAGTATSAHSNPSSSSFNTHNSNNHSTTNSNTNRNNSNTAIANIQRTFAGAGLALQPTLERARDGLDKARYKAEAGLSRRGFVRRTDMGATGAGDVSDPGSREQKRGEMEGLVHSHRGHSKGRGGRDDAAEEEDKGYGYGYHAPPRAFDSDEDDDAAYTTPARPTVRRQRTATAARAFGGEDAGPGPDVDRGCESDSDDAPGVGVGREKDNLKWPAGEGWRTL